MRVIAYFLVVTIVAMTLTGCEASRSIVTVEYSEFYPQSEQTWDN